MPIDIDRSLFILRPSFGPAGGPPVVILTDEGRERTARAAANVSLKEADALEAIGERRVPAERWISSARIQLTAFGETHGGPEALGGLTARGLAELVADQSNVRSYRLTSEGLRALEHIREDRINLSKFILNTLGNR